MRQLVDDGYLVPFRVFVAREIDTKGLKVVAGEWQKDELEKRGQQIVGDVVADYVRISNEVFGGYRKTICFSCGIAHGADLTKKFNEVGINAVQISSNDDEEYRAEVLSDFAKPESDIKVVISVAILSRGFDQSDVDYVILARPLKKSFSEHVQMVGRGARIHPEKNLCVIQDNSGNWLRFQDSWETLYNDGVTELTGEQDKKSRKEPSDKEKKEAKCPKCAVVWVGNTDVCSHCGHVRERKNDVVAVAGEMFELGQSVKKEKYTAEQKASWYAQLLGYAEEKGHNLGSAYYRYKDKFGVAPSMAKPKPIGAGLEVRNWITSRNIANAKRKSK
jgi:superfamily II DNA or RNA helicase